MSALVVRVGANISDFQREMNAMNETAQRVGRTMSAVGKTLSKKVTAPLMGIAAAATNVGSQFEKKMSTVAATTGASAADMDRLSRNARDLGQTTVFGARQVAGAMDAMGLAGWNATQVYDALPGVLNLAASSGLDLQKSTSIVTSAVNAFGLEASDAGRVVDVLATANKSSNISVAGLGDALKYVGSVAGAFGYTIEDVSLAIGLMANGGMAASQAGTSLRAAINELANPTEAAATKMYDLGISMFDAYGEAYPLQTVLRRLRASLADMSTEQQSAALSTIFGTTALTGMSHIINASEDDFNSLIHNLENADGNAAKFAATMQDNLLSELAIFRSKLEEAGIAIFQVLAPALRRLVGWLTNLVDRFNNLNPKTQEFLVRVGGIAAAIGPALFFGGKFVSFLGDLKVAFAVLKGAKGIEGVKTSLGQKGLVGSFGKAKGAAGGVAKAIVGIKAAPFVLAAAGIGVAAYGIHRSFRQEAIPAIDDLADRIVGLGGDTAYSYGLVSEQTQNIVGSFASLHIDAIAEVRALHHAMNGATEVQIERMESKIIGMTDFTIEELKRRRDEALATVREYYELEGILTREEIDKRVQEHYDGWYRRIAQQKQTQYDMLYLLEKAFDDEGNVVQGHLNELIVALQDYRYDALYEITTDVTEREVIMATWHTLEYEERQQQFKRLLELARGYHYDQIGILQGQRQKEREMAINHYGAQLAMTREQHSAIRDEMRQQFLERQMENNDFHESITERMGIAHKQGAQLSAEYHDKLIEMLRIYHGLAEGQTNEYFYGSLEMLAGYFSAFESLTAEEHESMLRKLGVSHEKTEQANRDTFYKQESELRQHYMDGRELTTEQLGLKIESIERSHGIQERNLERSLDKQLKNYQRIFSDISHTIDIETGKQLGAFEQFVGGSVSEMDIFERGWNGLRFVVHRLSAMFDAPINPIGNPALAGFANGTFSAPGGPTWVHERGPELINLPKGSQVIPAPLSSLMMQELGRSLSRDHVRNTHNQMNVETHHVNHHYNFAGMFDGSHISVREDRDIKRLSEEMAWLTHKQSSSLGGN